MSQVPDYTIEDSDGVTFIAQINALADAIKTINSGSAEPGDKAPWMMWADTGAGKLKVRNTANTSWLTALQAFGASAQGETFLAATTQAAQRTALGLGAAALKGFTDDDDLSVDPGNVGTRGNMAAAIAAQAFGVGQTMQDMSASRSVNTVYTNNTGRVIWVSVGLAGNAIQSLEVDGVKVSSVPGTTGVDAQMSAFVPSGSTYEAVGSSDGVNYWAELR